jgi:phospholipid/cholesterol/gamma-HCH transport system permease protein
MQQVSVVDRVGTGVLGAFESVGAIATFGARAFVEAARPPYDLREILRHVYQFGSRSAPLILTAGLRDRHRPVDAHTRLARAFRCRVVDSGRARMALIRETGPLTAGLLVAGRVGAGIGAEIGA